MARCPGAAWGPLESGVNHGEVECRVIAEAKKMRFMNRFPGVLALVLAAAGTNSAIAQDPVLTFSFNNLSGNFDVDSLLFTAFDTTSSVGDVIRPSEIDGAARFEGEGTPPFFFVSMDIVPESLSAVSAQGSGFMTLTDADGDTFVGDISGMWTNNGAAIFIGMLSGFTAINGGTPADPTFDGTDGSFFEQADLVGTVFEGNVLSLAFGDWFTDTSSGSKTPVSFSNSTTLAIGAVVPEPVTFSLLALGSLAIVARRRRNMH